MGESSMDEPGPPLLGMVDAAIFLSSPVGLASLLQNTGHQDVKSRLIEQKMSDRGNGRKHRFNKLFSLRKQADGEDRAMKGIGDYLNLHATALTVRAPKRNKMLRRQHCERRNTLLSARHRFQARSNKAEAMVRCALYRPATFKCRSRRPASACTSTPVNPSLHGNHCRDECQSRWSSPRTSCATRRPSLSSITRSPGLPRRYGANNGGYREHL